MAVARSYENCEILCEPFLENGRKYVNVRTPSGIERKVRWYSDAQYQSMYTKVLKPRLSIKDRLGFVNDYITIFKGNTYPHKDWLKEQGAKFTKLFNWSFASDIEWDECDLPEGLEPIQIPWEAVSINGELLSEDAIREYIDSLLYGPSTSSFIGTVGQRIEDTFTVTRSIHLEGYYGSSTMHILEDAAGNVYVWTTTAKSYPEGKVVTLRGTIKDHRVYRGTNQTVLTRCKEIAE